MPVVKTGDKWSVNDKSFDTEELANKAYMSYLDKMFGIEKMKPKKTTKKKKC